MNKQTFLTLLATFALLFSFTFSCNAKGKDKAKHVVFIGLDGFHVYGSRTGTTRIYRMGI